MSEEYVKQKVIESENKWATIVDYAPDLRMMGAKIVLDNDDTWIKFPPLNEDDESLKITLECIGDFHGVITLLAAVGIDAERC